jgi:hypothetical protein
MVRDTTERTVAKSRLGAVKDCGSEKSDCQHQRFHLWDIVAKVA